MQDKVSIVVPIYNVGNYVEQCIKSLVCQTYQNIEIILVDDGSTDASSAICQQYEKSDPRIHLISQKNKGLISARKAGVMRATGDYVAYVDGDDWVEPQMYSKMMEYALSYDADVVAGGHKEDLPGREETLTNVVACGLYTSENMAEEIYKCMICTNHFSQFGIFTYTWGKLYKRELIKAHQNEVPEEIHIGEDAACLYPLLLASKRLYVTDDAFYHYRQRTDSLIKTLESGEVEKVKSMYNFLSGKFATSIHREVLEPQLQKYALSLLIVRTDCDQLSSEPELEPDLFPFTDVQSGSRIAVCGAGTLGQHMIRRLSNKDEFPLVAWVDELHEEYKKLGLPVDSPEDLIEITFDHILVAFIDESIAAKVSDYLQQIGVQRGKICQVDFKLKNVTQILSRYGFAIK